MKPRYRLSPPLRRTPAAGALLAALCALTHNAMAQSTYYWDNLSGAGFGTAGGTWTAPTLNLWSTDLSGVAAPGASITTTTTDELNFGTATDSLAAGTINVSGTVNAKKLTFGSASGAVALSGGTINLGGGGGITVNNAANTISSSLTINGLNSFTGSGNLTLNTGTFTRSTGAVLQVTNTGTITSTMTGLATGNMVNGIIGPWALYGSGTSAKYATFSGNNIVGLTGTAAATAADVTSTAGTFNYDVAAVGALGAGASVNTLRYTGAAGSITGNLLTKGILNAGSGALTFSGTVGSGAVGNELVVSSQQNVILSGVVTGTITKMGGGQLTFNNAAHSLGGITVNAGTLIVNNTAGTNNFLSANGTNSGTGGTAIINSGGTFQSTGNNKIRDTASFVVNSGGTLDMQAGNEGIANVTGAGDWTWSANSKFLLAASGTFSGRITGGAGSTLGITASGTYTLSGAAANTSTAAITVNGGVLELSKTAGVNAIAGSLTIGNGAAGLDIVRLANSDQIIDTSVVTLIGTGANAGILRLNNQSETVAGLSSTGGAGIVENESGSAATSTLTANVASGTQTFDGILRDGDGTGTDGTLAFTKAGGGTQGLTGTAANTYAGTTTVTGGVLALGKTAGVNAIAGNLTIGDGTTTAGLDIVQLTNSNQIANTSVVTLIGTGANAGILRLNNQSETLAGLSSTLGAGIVENESGSDATSTLTANVASGTQTFSGILRNGDGSGTDGTLAFTKDGAGKQELTGANTYTGATNVTSGVLAVNGSLANTSTTVGNGGTLQGSGSIAGSVTVQNGGTLATGNSIESLATGTLSLEAGSTFAYELNNDAAAGVAGDLTAVTGDLTFDLTNAAILTLSELGAGSWTAGDKLTLISYTGIWNGGLFSYSNSTLADNSTFNFSGMEWSFNYNDTAAGTNYTGDLTGSSFVTMTAIPEPRAALLGSLGMLMLLRRRRA